MLKSLKMNGVGPAHEMSIEFAPRVNALTGDNGLGKSFLLDMAWWALTGTWARGDIALPRKGTNSPKISFGEGAIVAEGYADFFRGTYIWNHGSPRTESIVLYVGVDGNFLIWDPARLYPRGLLDEETWASELAGIFDLSPVQVWKGKSGPDGTSYCNGLIHDWVSWQKSGDPAFGELERVLSALSPSSTEKLSPGQPVHLDLIDETEYPTIKTTYGEDVPLVHASAGIRRIAALAYVELVPYSGFLPHSRLSTKSTCHYREEFPSTWV